MGVYSIKDLEIISGIKAHTLRIWEQRYAIITPKRTEGNIRFYDDADLKRLLNIAVLNQNGIKISKIATYDDHQISTEVLKVSEEELKFPDQVNNMVICMLNYDREMFDKVFSRCVLQLGFENTIESIIFPLLNRVGLLWLTGSANPAQEHFISQLIREKVMVALEGQIQVTNPDAKKFLLYLPEGEYHEIALLYATYILRSLKHHVLYLGQSLPFEHITEAYQFYKPNYIVANMTMTPVGYEIEDYIQEASKHFPDTTIFFAGFLFNQFSFEFPSNVRNIASMNELRNIR